MRSRFSAFSTGEADYLVETQHISTKSGRDRVDILKTIRETEWTNLIVVSTQRGLEADVEGQVEFVAVFRPKALTLMGSTTDSSAFQQLHERSSFVREEGRWQYVDGEALLPHEPKRNDPCWCGSGKKMKQCHG